MSTKVIVTNRTALKNKYGASYGSIEAAIPPLIAADRHQGIITQVVHLDDVVQMAKFNAPPVTDPLNSAQNKNAIDGVYKGTTPTYLMILGSIDIVPHQDMTNPMHDSDPNVPGDLPYACEAPYSRNPADFIAPTRVVGRLPDLTGKADVSYFVRVIAIDAALRTRPRSDYIDYFAVSCDVWKGSTSQSLTNIFGNSAAMKLSPPDGPNWTTAQYARRSHFVNCHGGSADPKWVGQLGSFYPSAVESGLLQGNLVAGTIATAECCYGAQLYDPSLAVGGRMGISSAYLLSQACAFFGSSNIAYGPPSGQGSADLITQYFLKSLLTGASAGVAALYARQTFVKVVTPLDPVALKTLAQFNLLGDPSAHPVAAPPLAGEGPEAEPKDETEARLGRRRELFLEGASLAATTAVPVLSASLQPSAETRSELDAFIAEHQLTDARIDSYEIRGGPIYSMMRERLGGPNAIHVAFGEAPRGENFPATLPPPLMVLVIKEQDLRIVSRQVLVSR